MATYERAAQANDLINRVARLNNQAHTAITNLSTMRGDLLALSAADRNAIIAAVGDVGYDATEIQSILNAWQAVLTTMNAQGIGEIQR